MTGCSYGGTLPFEVNTNGEFCDYALYMYPTVYTVAPGHTLCLYLTARDPCKACLDRDFISITLEKGNADDLIDYAFTVDNRAIHVRLPVIH